MKAGAIAQKVCRYFLAAVFLFSGIVKAVDPLGTCYKMSDYFEAFGVPELSAVALPAAFLMIIVEFTIGFNMLCSLKLKLTAVVAAVFMAVMTPVTLYLAIYNPVSDCGCFGDALVLTNWQTFYKNVVIDVVLIALFFLLKYDKSRFTEKGQWVIMLFPVFFCLGVELYSYRHLPIIDFRPYKVGNNISELMTVPEGAPTDRYRTTFVYSKDGVEKEFTLDNYPAEDSTWTFVRQNVELIEKGYTPPIHDFSIMLNGEDDITDIVLEREGSTLLVVSPKLENASEKGVEEVNRVYDWAVENEVPMYWLTSSFHTEIEDFVKKYNVKCPMAQTDEITLKTIIRSNPGLVLIKNGTVKGKWHYNDFPDSEKLHSITTYILQR